MIRRLYPALDTLLPGGLYACYQLDDAEFVDVVQRNPSAVRGFLLAAGYETTSFLSARKRHPDDADRLDVSSLRRVDPENPRRQYHVHLFDEGTYGTSIYSHLEYRPDPYPVGDESVRDAVARLREHYKPEWGSTWGDGVTYVQGRHCPEVYRVLTRMT